MVFVDSHAHLCMDAFDVDRAEVLARARDAGLCRLLCIGSLAGDMDAARALSEIEPDVFFATGLHPHEARLWNEDLRLRLSGMASHPRLLAIGEIGLDYHYHHSAPDLQREAFREQIRLARDCRLPIVIHTREAHDDTLRILKEEKAEEVGGVFHCFSGNRAMAEFAFRGSFLISFSGTLTFKNAGALREIAADAPMDRLITETDSPFLSPHPFRGRRNEPARVVEIVRCLAELKHLSWEAMGEVTTRNFESAFPRAARF
jgi:TatD DNase family protein